MTKKLRRANYRPGKNILILKVLATFNNTITGVDFVFIWEEFDVYLCISKKI